ncbi:MAG: redoxin domain-containing protein [Terriglobales bacterium]|jgi:peroxiredoxin
MTKSRISFITFSVGLLLLFAAPLFAVKIGDPAPDFKGTDSNGQTHELSAYRGKYVVLEWHNNGCPFTKKHYETGNMQKLQKEWTAKGVVWFTIISSAPGKQGYVTAAEENTYLKKEDAAPTAAILDPSGTIGHLYSAKTTPQLIIVDPSGKVVYDGAIDDRPTPEQSDVAGANNYVNAALTELTSGKPVTMATSRPYGCSVKYGD